MAESRLNLDVPDNNENAEVSTGQAETGNKKKSLSMHDDVPVWCDCCSCEAEPYWIEMMAEPSSN